MKLAVAQFAPRFAEPERNATEISHGILSTPADLIIYPECALTGYCFGSREAALDVALRIDSQPIQMLLQACGRVNAYAIVGLAETDGEHIYNSAVLIGPAGIEGVYRKTHIPCLGLDRFVTPGRDLPVFNLPFGKIGILICFDIRFPEAPRSMALRGADLICLPTNWPETAESASDIICPARAIENHVFVAAANRVGTESGFHFVGKSKIVAPGGEILAAADHDEETILIHDVNLAEASNKQIVKRPGEYEMHLIESRRPNLYAALTSENFHGTTHLGSLSGAAESPLGQREERSLAEELPTNRITHTSC